MRLALVVVVGMVVVIVLFRLVCAVVVAFRDRPSDECDRLPDGWAVPLEAPLPVQEARVETAAELIQRIRAVDWFQFEQLVAVVYGRLGYAVARRGGARPDGGIDLVVESNGEAVAVQCKHWKTWNVGVKAVRELLGALTDAGIGKGALVMLGGYTGEAKRLADKHGIQIVNESGLTRMLEEIQAARDPEVLAILSDERKICPRCEAPMLLRTAAKGPTAGRRFWGCSTYPRCRFTMRAE
ncbi:MAG: restriction endonuclease [Verrucomicrobiales bacterium]|nr:restriction endonuclease [Verrucomicrobiales bacterium]